LSKGVRALRNRYYPFHPLRTFIVMPTAANRRQVPRIAGPKFDDVGPLGLAVRGRALRSALSFSLLNRTPL
jgi:hypothetical protein